MDDIVSVKPYNNIKAEYPSTVLEIKMYERIRGGCLNSALKSALKRYPYFTYKFIEREGNFFWTEDCDNFTVTQTDKLRKLGTASAGYHFVDVTYSGCCIRIAFYHGVCDARGIIPFARTLIWRYCCQRYNRQFASGDIRLPDSKLLEGETDTRIQIFMTRANFLTPISKANVLRYPL
ncbi:MAG: hypothetical protein LUD27_01765 [Clostridia bacterium]|nr:hypothetical protein [Clostridia bacterium]